MAARLSCFLLAAALCTAPRGPLDAQQGAIAGRVTNATTLAQVPLAKIRVIGGAPPIEVTSEADGSFEIHLPEGVYDLLVEAGGFPPKRFDRVPVRGGLTTTRNLLLESRGYRLAGFIVTPGRGSLDTDIPAPEPAHPNPRTPDTEITAPSSSHAVSSRVISERPTPSPVEHLRESPGVDIGTHGIQASNVVLRGFNNIFSGALRMLTDYRLAGLPALRANFMHFLPLNDLDMERVEVVLGPGSALYGPNTAKGMLHVITRSPMEGSGSTVSLAVGEQSILQGAFRSAYKVGGDLAFKISGQFLRGEEWPHLDSAELKAKQDAGADPERCKLDRQRRGATPVEAELACRRVGVRDYGVGRYGLEARADWRYSRRGTLVGTYGVTQVSGIELTGLGATQIHRWIHQFVQGRFTYDRWAVQAYFNFNDSGDAYQLRAGLPLIDRSWLGALQVQNGFTIADGRQDFTYGWDYFVTHPRSQGTIYGGYEGANDMKEWGIYLQSRTRLGPKVDLIAAGRVDDHSILPDRVFSPRLALVVKPNASNALRFAYNRAFDTPTALNYFLDFGAGPAPHPLGELGYAIRAFGSGHKGFAWRSEDGGPRGMRSPFHDDAGTFLPANVATLWRLGLGEVQRRALLPQEALALLQGLTPGPSDVGMLFTDVNSPDAAARPIDEWSIPDVPPIREGSTETLEAGWSGVLGNALRVSVDVYHMTQRDFVSPLTVETPLLSLSPTDLGTWLTSTYVPARAADLAQTLGVTMEVARAQATQEAALLAGLIGQMPLAVVSSDAPAMAHGGADLIATYRNLGDLSLWGADATFEWLVGRRWTLRGTYSHVDRNWFTSDGTAVALNAPKDKGTVGVAFRDEGWGLHAAARVRYTGGFPFLSTDYAGTRCIPGAASTYQEDCIASRALVDVNVGFRLPNTRASVQLGVNNLLDTPYRSFVGVPAARRLAMVRLRYDLF